MYYIHLDLSARKGPKISYEIPFVCASGYHQIPQLRYASSLFTNHSSFGSNNCQFFSRPAIHSHIKSPYSRETADPSHPEAVSVVTNGKQHIITMNRTRGAIRIHLELTSSVFGLSKDRFRSAMHVMKKTTHARLAEADQMAYIAAFGAGSASPPSARRSMSDGSAVKFVVAYWCSTRKSVDAARMRSAANMKT